jgi:glycosyltransferase involved in cell wall biosynthesis
MVKYISQTHWEPIVYTALNPEAPIFDNSLVKDIPSGLKVIRRKAIEPYRFFRLLTFRRSNLAAGFASSKKQKSSWITNLAIWIRGNCFIPDARALWVKPSTRFLLKYLKSNPVDAIITTGPPHSMHLIGLKLKQKLGLKWIADFRDPWTNIDYFNDLKLTNGSKKKHFHLEKQVVQSADAIVVVSKQMQREFEYLLPKIISIIPNGFDDEDFKLKSVDIDSYLSVTHTGTVPPNRDNPLLWNCIADFIKTNTEFAKQIKLRFIGEVDATVVRSIQMAGIMESCQFLGYVPHSEAIDKTMRSQVLLLLINNSNNANGILTGKLYEYMASGRPILAIGPRGGDLEVVLSQTGAGRVFAADSAEDINKGLEWIWKLHKNSFQEFSTKGIGLYTRKNLSLQMVRLLDELMAK